MRRRHRLHAGILALLTTVLVTEHAPPSPLALVDAFDEAIALATTAADAQITELERRCDQPSTPRVSYAAVLDLAERHAAARDDAATGRLDRTLATTPGLSPRRHAATLACIDHHLAISAAGLRHALTRPDDPFTRLEVAEYRATLRRLLAVPALVAA